MSVDGNGNGNSSESPFYTETNIFRLRRPWRAKTTASVQQTINRRILSYPAGSEVDSLTVKALTLPLTLVKLTMSLSNRVYSCSMPNHGSRPGAASKASRALARVLDGMGSPVGRHVSHRTSTFSPPRKGSCFNVYYISRQRILRTLPVPAAWFRSCMKSDGVRTRGQSFSTH